MRRVESSELWTGRFTRRDFLRYAAVGAGGVISGAIAIKAIPGFFLGAPEAENLEPKLVGVGVFAVSKGVNIRTSPRIPDRTRFRKPDNRIDWDEIETVNEVPLEKQSTFLIVNPSIVEGQDTYSGYGGTDWIKLAIGKRGEMAEPYYINSSEQTGEFLKWLGYAGYAGGDNSWASYDFIGRFNFEDLGRVVIPRNPDTMARDIMPKIWAERMKIKFGGELGSQDKMLTNLQVIAAGSEKEVVDMIKLKTPVNVRDYPSLGYGDGEPVSIVGKISQGTVINKALVPPDDGYHYHFAAVQSEDIRGSLLDAQNNSFTPSVGEIYAINLLYLSTT